MPRWYSVYRNEVFQYYAYGDFMKVTASANQLFEFRDIVTVKPTNDLGSKSIDELLKEGFDIDIKVTHNRSGMETP